MNEMKLMDLAVATQGQILSTIETVLTGVGTDTRQDLTGQIFFALRGDRFDAHDFLERAVAQKAGALVVDRDLPASLTGRCSVVRVPDTLKALQDFASFWRHQQRAQIIGITGSNGKTTTKQFTATLLKEKFVTLANEGSFNNHWGVPLTLLKIRPEHEVAVIEMGMNHAGEITRLCEIADPDCVVVTMVGRAHIEYFGTIENIAKAKKEIYEASRPQATRIYNLDNPLTRQMRPTAHGSSRTLTFSSSEPADVRLRLTSSQLEGLDVEGDIGGVAGAARVPVFGEQNLTNLQAAAALALAAGVSPSQIWTGLAKCGSAWGRNQWLRLPMGARVLFDAYNANPDSMRALLENTRRLPSRGRKFAVLGEMKEMGELSAKMHEELGEISAQVGFEAIYFVGTPAASFEAGLKRGGFNKKLIISNTCEQMLARELAAMLNPDDIVIVKGSRGVHLEKVVSEWNPENFQLKT